METQTPQNIKPIDFTELKEAVSAAHDGRYLAISVNQEWTKTIKQHLETTFPQWAKWVTIHEHPRQFAHYVIFRDKESLRKWMLV